MPGNVRICAVQISQDHVLAGLVGRAVIVEPNKPDDIINVYVEDIHDGHKGIKIPRKFLNVLCNYYNTK